MSESSIITDIDDSRLAIIGLGYVGLPLAVAFGRQFATLGFDINSERVATLRGGVDVTREVEPEELAQADKLEFTTDPEALRDRDIYIISVPTPIDADKRPDFGPLIAASATVGRVMAPGALVIYESTVYPGATEQICVPVLERESGLKYQAEPHPGSALAGVDAPSDGRVFTVGYSPERINPGDRTHRLADIVKVTSGSTPVAAARVDALYRRIIDAGTHKAESIVVAEAAKVIENTQRDLNIALVNELALIFNRMGIDTQAVLAAAGSKWNFLPFRPGLVGGHCIGVDPYYLTHKAQQVGYHPEVILAGRRINDGMGRYVAEQVVKLMIRRDIKVLGARVLILGLAFKENCPDPRNTRVIDIVRELVDYGARVAVHDPWVAPEDARRQHGLELIEQLSPHTYDAVIIAVAHDQYAAMGPDAIRALGRDGGVLYDVKHLLPAAAVDGRL